MTAIRTSAGHEPDPVSGKWRAATLYTLLTILLAYPLSVTAGRHLIGTGNDDMLIMWILAWNTHALVTQPLSIFDANIFYPNANTLAYSENLIGSAFFAAPVLWLTGNPVLAVNVVALLSCVLCGLGAYVLGRRVGLSATASVLAGLIFAFSPARFLRFSQIHLTVVQWIPFTLASLHAYLDGGRRRDLLLATGFFTLQALSSGHGGVFLILSIALILGYRFAAGEAVLLARRVRDFGVMGLCLVAPAALLMIPYRAAQVEVGIRRPLGDWDTPIENFFASPTRVDVFLQSLVTSHDINGVATSWLFPGVVPLGLALLAIVTGAMVLARHGVTFPAWIRPSRLWPRGVPAYRWPIRILAATAIVWALVPLAHPAFHAGEGLSVERFADSTVVQIGYITVGEPGLYRFRMTADGNARLIVNDRVVIGHNQLRPDASSFGTGSVPLSARSHRVLLEYELGDGQQFFEWGWRPPAGAQSYRGVSWWSLSQRPVSYASVIGVRVVDALPLGLAVIAGLAATWCVYVWLARRREAWVAWGARYRTSRTGLYLLLTVACIALALGPPYGLWQYVYWLPGFNFIRASSRFMVPGVLGIAVLAGIGFDRTTTALAMTTRRLAGAGVGALLLLEFTVVPFAGVPYQVETPAVDQWLARKDERFSIVEVPVTRSVRYHSTYMLHSMAHWQKTVNGYSGIRPDLHIDLYEDLETFPNEDSLRELARLDVTYLVVHLSSYSTEKRRTVEQGLRTFDAWLTLEYEDPESRIYLIHRPAGGEADADGAVQSETGL